MDLASPVQSMEQAHGKVCHLLDTAKTTSDAKKMYETWAHTYEEDMVKIFYKIPATLASYMNTVVSDKESKILEMGVGTGLHGIELQRAGYLNIDAVEACDVMLEKAKTLGIYKRYICDYVGKNRLDIQDNTYDVVTGSGCFVPAHITHEAFEELCRILKPGGLLFVTFNERYYEDQYEGYADKLDKGIADLTTRGLWVQTRRDSIPCLDHYSANVIVLQKK